MGIRGRLEALHCLRSQALWRSGTGYQRTQFKHGLFDQETQHVESDKCFSASVLEDRGQGQHGVCRDLLYPWHGVGKRRRRAPSERIVMGGIGIGRGGGYDLSCFLPEADVQFVAVCDVKAKRRAEVKQIADKKYGNQDCATYRDMHELLDRDDIDAVLIATGPNWHATAACLAARYGKDMYCEKPCTKNIAKSLALAETMRRTGRCSKQVPNVGTCLTSPLPVNWRAPEGSANSARSTPTRLG